MMDQLHSESDHIRENENQFISKIGGRRNLADAIPHIVWWASSSGEIHYLNRCWCEYTGQNLVESLNSGWQRSFQTQDLKLLMMAWSQSQQVSKNFEIECRIRNRHAEYRWHRVKGVRERVEGSEEYAWFGTCTDIHDLKTAQEKMRAAQKAAENANKAKTHFLANMSHEIRTPLGAMIGFTELLLDPQASDEDKASHISIVRRNSQQLLKIIDEILDISKVEAGRLETERIETNLIALLKEIQDLLSVSASEKGIQLSFVIRDKIPTIIWTDPTRLRQIVLNIVGNAIKFTKEGFVQIVCSYRTTDESKSYLQISVEDTGIGVDAELGERLFTPFLQADSSTTRMFGGTGLGLALSRQLARALGGDLWLERTVLNQGSLFSFEIQAEPSQAAQWALYLTDERKVMEITKPSGPKGDLEGTRILLVEDAEDNQVLIGHFLKKAGAIIDMANNGREGVEKALRNEYEAVLMDIQMPFLDGYEATTQLRLAGYKKPIIALTAHALREEREKALNTGCNGHLTKPINRVELIESLKRLVKS